MLVQRLAYHDLLVGVGEDFACGGGGVELVGVGEAMNDALPKLGMGDGGRGGRRVDGLSVR